MRIAFLGACGTGKTALFYSQQKTPVKPVF